MNYEYLYRIHNNNNTYTVFKYTKIWTNLYGAL